ncbi:MAG: hypothetical protein AB7P33_16105, partial [Dehalococcoidia bacterium]
MYHIVFLMLSATVLGMGWMLVHSAPPLISRILPRTLTFIVGSFLALFGAFGAFMDAYYLRDASGVFGCFVMIVVGTWFMLAPSAGNRGTYRDEQLMKRIFIMLSFVFIVITCALYLPQYRAVAILNLLMVTAGLWFTANYFKEVD